MARKKKTDITDLLMSTGAAAAGGAAAGVVANQLAGLVGPEYSAPATLAVAGAAQYFTENPLIQAAALGMAGVAGAALAVDLFPDVAQGIPTIPEANPLVQ